MDPRLLSGVGGRNRNGMGGGGGKKKTIKGLTKVAILSKNDNV